MVKIPRCEVCGEPISSCGGCGMLRHVHTKGCESREPFYGNPPEYFEMDKDIYRNPNFIRKVNRAKKRRTKGLDTDDRYQDDTTKYVQCPYEDCKTWFPIPIEYINKKSKLRKEYIECPFCFRVSKAGKKDKLEKVQKV